jgi:hypothetical protein
MKFIALVTAAALCAGGLCYAKMGELVASFPAPKSFVGLAADADNLYSLAVATIYVLDKGTGSIKVTYPTLFTHHNLGLGYEGGGYLHFSNSWYELVVKIRASDGSLISTWTPEPVVNPGGLCVANDKENPGTADGIFFHGRIGGESYIFFFTTTGSFITLYQPDYRPSTDLAWDYRNEYIWYGYYGGATDSVVGITPDNSVVNKWPVPRGVEHPNGIAYYGEYLYVCTTRGVPGSYVWVYHCPKGSPSVEPASLGRVKALFR